MRKIVLLLTFIGITLFSFYGCEDDEGDTCKTCRIVTYDASGSFISEGQPQTLCGDELLSKEGTSEKIGDYTAVWECD